MSKCAIQDCNNKMVYKVYHQPAHLNLCEQHLQKDMVRFTPHKTFIRISGFLSRLGKATEKIVNESQAAIIAISFKTKQALDIIHNLHLAFNGLMQQRNALSLDFLNENIGLIKENYSYFKEHFVPLIEELENIKSLGKDASIEQKSKGEDNGAHLNQNEQNCKSIRSKIKIPQYIRSEDRVRAINFQHLLSLQIEEWSIITAKTIKPLPAYIIDQMKTAIKLSQSEFQVQSHGRASNFIDFNTMQYFWLSKDNTIVQEVNEMFLLGRPKHNI